MERECAYCGIASHSGDQTLPSFYEIILLLLLVLLEFLLLQFHLSQL